jgi:hypothetical protein
MAKRKVKKWPGEKDKNVFARVASREVRETRAGLIPSEETDGLTLKTNICQNCRKPFADHDLDEITHGIWERVSPGEIMPSGECPNCGALCHPIKNTLTPFIGAARKLVETVAATGGLIKYPDGTFAPAGEPEWIDLGDAVLALQSLLIGEGIKVRLPMKRA